ncbi:MAG: V-type ATP synthase subunit E [Candidatus Diapherotrites archaeon]|nr:V-type ATP synthase subunit E [Candidatus Micrarchaeota archaeon]MBU1939333.1 V-type ATP synthase subunit E [Candidatus Micrarchaeota archaeon]
MRVYGNMESVKGAIKERYEKEASLIENEAKEKEAAAGTQAEAELEALHEKLSAEADNEAQQAYQRVFNEKKLAAKQEFEAARQEMIEEVFSAAEKEAEKFASGKEYLEFVKKHAPKGNFKVFGGSASYKSAFPNMQVDNEIKGIIFRGENVEYNFTVERMLDAKKEELRNIVTKALFGE